MTQTQTQTNAIHLDPFTIKVLSNFATINSGIVIRPGSEIRTMTESRSVLAEATVPDIFPVEFAIHDLRQLLSFMASLFDNPSIGFCDNHLKISSGSDVTKIYYSNPNLVASPSKRITMPSEDISFELSSEVIQRINKSSSILSVDDLLISSTDDGNSVSVSVLDKTNSAANIWYTTVPGSYTQPFTAYFKIANLKILDGTYSVTISKKGLSLFKNNSCDLRYYVAVESNSKF